MTVYKSNLLSLLYKGTLMNTHLTKTINQVHSYRLDLWWPQTAVVTIDLLCLWPLEPLNLVVQIKAISEGLCPKYSSSGKMFLVGFDVTNVGETYGPQ